MDDLRTLVRDEMARAGSPSYSFNDLGRRRDRKRRNQRIAAGVVGIAVFVGAAGIVTTGLPFDRTKTPGAAGTGPAVTGSTLIIPRVDFLLDLETGVMTPLPEAIVGTEDEDLTGHYAVSPDGSRLAYVGPGSNGEGQIFVANLDGTGVEQVTNDLRASLPAWSPDGSTIAYIGRRGDDPSNVFLLDRATGASTQLTFEESGMNGGPHSAGPDGLSFSPDGSSILYSVSGRDGGEVRIVPTAGGESVRLVGGDGVDAGDGQLSPDGSLLSYSCEVDICLANADGADAGVLVSGHGLDFLKHASWSPDGTRLVYMQNYAGVFLVDVASGDVTYALGVGAYPLWLDNHTLIVETDRCNLPGNQCPG